MDKGNRPVAYGVITADHEPNSESKKRGEWIEEVDALIVVVIVVGHGCTCAVALGPDASRTYEDTLSRLGKGVEERTIRSQQNQLASREATRYLPLFIIGGCSHAQTPLSVILTL